MSGLSRRINDNFDMLHPFETEKVFDMINKKIENETTFFLQKIVMDFLGKH